MYKAPILAGFFAVVSHLIACQNLGAWAPVTNDLKYLPAVGSNCLLGIENGDFGASPFYWQPLIPIITRHFDPNSNAQTLHRATTLTLNVNLPQGWRWHQMMWKRVSASGNRSFGHPDSRTTI